MVCPNLPPRIEKCSVFFSFFFLEQTCNVSLSLSSPDSPRAARREVIDYLAHKMDFVMFGANI